MEIANLQALLLTHFALMLLLAVAGLLSGRSRLSAMVIICTSLIGLAAVIEVASRSAVGRNVAVELLTRVMRLSRTDVTAVGFGIAAALPFVPLLFGAPGRPSEEGSKRRPRSRYGSFWAIAGAAGLLATGLGFVAKDLISPYLPNPGSRSGSVGIGQLVAEGFEVADFADTALIPVRIAVSPGGRIFVSGHLGIAAQEGGVAELIAAANGTVSESLVARMLNRPYGLIATDEELFVSRSGQYTRWSDGRAEQLSTGAVTRLVDTDGDGLMDYYDDVVTDLPGAKGPDYLHQNNGIALGADGALYITTANNSDAHPPSDVREGVILRASGDDFADVEIHASGLRNPFGLAFDDGGRLYATDNDAQTGLLGGNLGDKLLEVREGAFYGHPYATDDADGVVAPLLRSSFALGGLAYAKPGSLPSPWDDSLYVVIYGEGRVARIDFDRSAPSGVEFVPLATVPGAVDVAISNEGELYVAVYPDKVVRIRPVGEKPL